MPTAPPRLSRAEAKAKTRADLLVAAASVFARRGYEAATVVEIAEQAGRTIGALYGHFATKEDVFLALLDEQVDLRVAENRSTLNAGPPDESPGRLAAWFEGLAEDEMGVLAIEFWLSAVRNPKMRAKTREIRRRARDGLAAVFAEQYDRQNIDPPRPVDELATMCMAVAEGLAMARRIDPKAVTGNMFAFAVGRITRSED